MNDATHLDARAIGAYLKDKLPGFDAPFEVHKFDTGQSNPTFRLQTHAGDYVLRRKPPGQLLKSAHAVDREYRIQSALAGTDVPVPAMHLLCEDTDVIGSMFYIMAHVAGENHPEPSRAGSDPAMRSVVIEEMNRVLAALHMIDPDAVGLGDYGPPGDYFARQIARWTKQYRASETDAVPDMDRLIAMLPERHPQDDGQRTIVHGDYRLDNMIFDGDTGACQAVLDWELSTLGHPYADLAAVIMQWQLPPGDQGRGLGGLDRDALGLPSDDAFIAGYCEKRGLSGIDDFGFYLSFTFFRMAAIIQGVLRRALDGNASNPARARALGAFVPVFAEKGLAALKGSS